MKYPVFLLLLLAPAGLLAQANERVALTLNRDASVTITLKTTPAKSYRLTPRFLVLQRDDDPKLHYENASKLVPELGTIAFPCWKKPNGAGNTADFFQSAATESVTATAAKANGNEITWVFPTHAAFRLTASLTLPAGTAEPVVRYQFVPKKEAYYSVGFAGMPELAPQQADAIWQPWVWQEKRFPTQSFLSVEEMCGLPATMVEQGGFTYGVVADPDRIPYRLPTLELGRLAFGLLLRNQAGQAQPQFFAPVLGTAESKLRGGQAYESQCRLLFRPGTQPEAFRYVAQTIFEFRDYRKNVFGNLNQTIENFVEFGMNDVYCGWNPDLRGFDYTTDVAHTVKVVSGLHPLSVALLTDNESVYRRRALPMLEFGLSREKYLFAILKTATRQNASGRMAGPNLEVGDLGALQAIFRGRTPAFGYLADSLKSTTRYLNLRIESKGDSWPNLLGLYRMNRNPATLQAAKQGADRYIAQRIATPQIDFSDAHPAGTGQFWTDFAPLWMELLDLYEETQELRYLEAARIGANRYVEYCWFSPRIPGGTVAINPEGIANFRSHEGKRENMPFMVAAPQTVPAWRVSQIGLTPEACNTFPSNPAIFLTHYAPHLLRLAHYTKDDFLKAIARSAVVGRYTNYPGYDINGLFTTVYEQPDYPLRPWNEISYNQVYYNHVWPQIAMLFDYLISEAFTRSDGQVRFPHQFAPGYAYLKSKVYGHAPGEFYGEKNVSLWLPRQVLKLDHEQVNHLTAHGNGNFYVALTNQSDDPVDVTLTLNPNVVPVDVSKAYAVRTWEQNQPGAPLTLRNGAIRVRVAPKGITALSVDGLSVRTGFQEKALTPTPTVPTTADAYQRLATPVGNVTALLFSLGQTTRSAYVWLEATAEQLKKATLHYRPLGATTWQTQEDTGYPFEFSVPVPDPADGWEWRVEGTTPDGNSVAAKTGILKSPRLTN